MGRVFIFCFYFQWFKNITQTSSILLFWQTNNTIVLTLSVNISNRFWFYYQNFDIVFLITGNADTIYNIRNHNEMTDRNRKLSGNTANLTVFRLLTDFVCLYNYEFGLSLCKIVRSSVILLLPLFSILKVTFLKSNPFRFKETLITFS
jgi:hypothetical protein